MRRCTPRAMPAIARPNRRRRTMPMARPGRRSTSRPGPNGLSPTRFGLRRAGRTPGSTTASPATARARSRTPRRRCAGRSARAPGHAAATANLGAFMRITGEARGGRGAAARDTSRASPTTSARGSISPPICCRRSARPRRWRCSRAEPPSDNRAPTALASAASRWRCCSCRPAEARAALDASRRSARFRRSSRRCRIGGACCWRAPERHRRARREAERMEAALADVGAGGGARTPDHGAFRSRQILVGPGRASRAFAHWTEGHALLKPHPAVFARCAPRPSSTPISRSQPRARFAPAPAPETTIRRRSSSSACRAPARRCANRSSPRIATRMARASGSRCRARSHGSAALTRRRRCAGSLASMRRRSTPLPHDYLSELHALAPGQGAHRRQDAGQLSVPRPCRADAAGREDHPLRARSARHRAFDLHFPLLRPSCLCARSCRPRLDHRRA